MQTPTTEPLVETMTRIIQTRIESDRLVVPTFPQAATKCLALVKDANVNAKRLVAVLEVDPVFAAQVTRAASGAAFGGQAARNLETAINRLGTNQLRVVLTQAAAKSLFASPNRAIAGRLAGLWKHSVAVAMLARDIGALVQLADVEVAYLTGLLHDVGKTVVAGMLLEAEAILGRKGWITADQWAQVVDAAHRPLGVALAERWNLDPEVVDAIRDCQEYNAGDRQSAANVVRFANALVKVNGLAGSRNPDLEDAGALVMIGRSMLGLDEEVVNRLAQGLKERVDSAVA